MAELILIKHAKPQIEPGVPSDEWHLSAAGRRQCEQLSGALAGRGIGVMFCSTEPKAVQTADALADRLGVPCHAVQDLHEHARRTVPHLRPAEFISMMELMFRRPEERVLGEESANEAAERFERAVQSLLQAHPDQTVAIVTHGTVLSLFVSRHSDRSPFALWRELQLPSFVVFSRPDLNVVEVVPRPEDRR